MEKKDLSISEIIYKFHRKNSFFDKKDSFKIMYGFSYNNFKDMIFKNTFIKERIISEPKENIICVLIDSENFINSIFFTKNALYIENSITNSSQTKILYSEIRRINIQDKLILTLINGKEYSISKIWKIENIAKFLDFIALNYNSKNKYLNEKLETYITEKRERISLASKIVYGNISNAATNYGLDKFSTPRGHGFAAERANHIYDVLTGKKAVIVGDDNVLNGADRIVDGISIQSKYCNSGSNCIKNCFKNGEFRYLNRDGTPMQIEVPADKYDSAVEAMKNRIRNGEIPTITNPEDAEKIVRKGHFTYEQAKNIAKAGTIESITFDSTNGIVIGSSSFGITTCITFATSLWNGESFNKALKNATYSGIKVGGTTFITAVLSSQLSRAGLNSLLVGSSEAVVGILGSKASSVLVNAFRSGNNIYGAAAMKSAAKLLRGNVITAGISVAVLSTVDVVNIFRGRISGAQLFKNVANTASTVAGGTAGWIGGATVGATMGSFIPVFGTVAGGFIGGVIGSFAGGTAAGKVSNEILNNFIEDDANEMIKILENKFSELSFDYLLNSSEAERVADNLKEYLTGSTLKDMFASNNRYEFAKNLIEPYVEFEARNRKRIVLPTEKQVCREIKNILEEIADKQ